MSKFKLEMTASGQPRISSVVDIPGALKHLSMLLAENAKVPIHQWMTPAQLTAAYEKKAELALEGGQFYRQNLSRNLADWQDMPRRAMIKCIGLEAGDVDTPNLRQIEAGDYTDPNAQFGTLSGTLVMLRALPLYAYEYPELAALFTDFSAEPGFLEQESLSRIVKIPAVQKFNNTLDGNNIPVGFETASPAKTVDVPITLTDYIAVPMVFSAGSVEATNRDLVEEQAPAGIKAIATYFINMLTALLTPANYNAYGVVTADNPQTVPIAYASYGRGIQDWSMTDMDKLSAIFTTCMVPKRNRGILLSTAYYAKLRSDPRLDFFFAASKADPQLTEQQLPQGLSGFFPYEAAYLPNSLPFFAFHKAGVVLKQRLPAAYASSVKAMIPGSITTVTDPETKLSVSLVQRIDLVKNYAEWRPEAILGAGVGDNRGGLCGSQ